VNERVGPLPGWVTYDDPTTGEQLFRPRTPEDVGLPGDERTFEGKIERNSLDFLGLTIDGVSREPGFLRPLFLEWMGKRILVTVEVLPDPPATAETARGR
jgi:hypothetical protein